MLSFVYVFLLLWPICFSPEGLRAARRETVCWLTATPIESNAAVLLRLIRLPLVFEPNQLRRIERIFFERAFRERQWRPRSHSANSNRLSRETHAQLHRMRSWAKCNRHWHKHVLAAARGRAFGLAYYCAAQVRRWHLISHLVIMLVAAALVHVHFHVTATRRAR